MGEADRIGPDMSPKKTLADRANGVRKTFFTKHGLVGNYDYAFLFRPNIPFLNKTRRASPFFGLHDDMPVVLALLLGFQHALAMLAGIITPPLIMAGQGGVNLDGDWQQYLVSTSLIVCGILSSIQITRFHIYKTPYYIGTGLISVVGTSFAIIPVATGSFSQMYSNGFCPVAEDGTKLPCPDAYGALIGTCAVCALVEIALSFLPPHVLKKIFPPIVTGPTVMLIGISLIQSGFEDWAGGSGSCMSRPDTGIYQLCPDISAPHALPWGSAEFVGLGFLVFVTIIICERFGSPIMKSTSVILGLLTGCIVAAACGYFDRSGIDSAPVASFIWVKTFKLSVYGPLVLPIMTVFIICACEAIGDVTATCDVSKLEVEGREFESRIQGGVLADGLNGCLAALMTITPMSTFAQNNGVIALTRCANRRAGYCCCFFLIIMGLFAKFSAALVAIPSPVLGGMTTFLFCAVAVSGMAIVSRVPFNRRTRFVLTAALAMGYGATLVPTWFSYVFTYEGGNHALRGFYDAIVLVLETGFAVTAFVAMILNLILPAEIEDIPAEAAEEHHRRHSTSTSTDGETSKVAVPSKEVV
jgi:uracil-xanthine permease